MTTARYTLTGYGQRSYGTKREEICLSATGSTLTAAGHALIELIEAQNPYYFENHRRFCEPSDGGWVWWEDQYRSLDKMSQYDNVVPVYDGDGEIIDYVRSTPAIPTYEAIRRFALEVLDVCYVLLAFGEDRP